MFGPGAVLLFTPLFADCLITCLLTVPKRFFVKIIMEYQNIKIYWIFKIYHGISRYILDMQDISWKIIMYFIQYLRDPINAINFIFDHFDRLYRENLADRIEQCLFFVIFVSRKYVIKCQKCPNVAFYRFCVRLVVVVVVVVVVVSSSERYCSSLFFPLWGIRLRWDNIYTFLLF